mgnify:CR=1 FL=1
MDSAFGVRLTALMENLPATGDDAQHQANLVRLQRAAKIARALAPEQVPEVVRGYTIANDVTARDFVLDFYRPPVNAQS